MSVIAQDVFITAMKLMGEESQDGTYDGYPEEYKGRAWSILTLLQVELTSASQIPSIVDGVDTVLSLDDRTCLSVLPYGLAAHLLMDEDQNKAAFFNARYDELKRKVPSDITNITDVYNIFGTIEDQTNEAPSDITVILDGGEIV